MWITELIAADYHTLIVTLLNLKCVCVSVFPPNFFFFFFKTQHTEVTLMSQLCQNRKITIIERCSQTVGTFSLPHVSSSGSSFAFSHKTKSATTSFTCFGPWSRAFKTLGNWKSSRVRLQGQSLWEKNVCNTIKLVEFMVDLFGQCLFLKAYPRAVYCGGEILISSPQRLTHFLTGIPHTSNQIDTQIYGHGMWTQENHLVSFTEEWKAIKQA